MNKQPEMMKTSIGGQALIEGVMMRGPHASAMAVRMPDREINVELWPQEDEKKPWYKRTPIIRGTFNFVDSMGLGYRCLMLSAEKAGQAEEAEPDAFERWLTRHFGPSGANVVMGLAAVLGVALAMVLFVFLPTALAQWVLGIAAIPYTRLSLALLEGILKVGIFVL